MATGRSTKLTGAVGEFLVSAELCRRGLMATPFSGNVPHYDIIASDDAGNHAVIQVKTANNPTWQSDVGKFVSISMDGKKQIMGDLVDEPYPDLIYVFVALENGDQGDEFFVLTWQELQQVIVEHHSEYLRKKGGVRPRNPESTHCSIGIDDIARFKNQWAKIKGCV